jgi:hypothetical protein
MEHCRLLILVAYFVLFYDAFWIFTRHFCFILYDIALSRRTHRQLKPKDQLSNTKITAYLYVFSFQKPNA